MQLTLQQRVAAPGVASIRSTAHRAARSRCSIKTQAFFFKRDPEKDAELEEQYRTQQELLQRRKTGAWQKEVVERRKDVSRYLNDKEYKKQVDAEKRKRFDARRKEEEEAKKGAWVIVPINPMGMPEYDGGERFDLRGKYVDEGWVDPEGDVFQKLGRWLKGKKGGE